MTTNTAFAKLQSPDELIQRLRFDVDPVPSDPFDLLDFLKRDDAFRLRLRMHDKAKELPLLGIKQLGGTISVQPLDTVLKPGLNPFLILENISIARSLFADCLELRRRIEALQLDLFNFAQESYEYDELKKLRIDEIARLEAEVALRKGLLEDRKHEDSGFSMVSILWSKYSVAFNTGNAPPYDLPTRVANAVVQQFWPLSYSATQGGAANLIEIHNAPLASTVFGASVFDTVKRAITSEAKRRASLEDVNEQNESWRIEQEKWARAGQRRQLQDSKAAAEHELKMARDRNTIKDEKWRRKAAQFDSESGLGLNRRLRDSLLLYAELTGQLRTALHTIEFGQDQALGLMIPGFDANARDLRDRYLLEPANDPDPKTPLADLQAQANRQWISLDTLGRYLVQAEVRIRTHAQSAKVTQTVLKLDGVLDAANSTLQLEQTIGENKAQLAIGPKKNILALRLLNLGDPVSLILRLHAPETPAMQLGLAKEDTLQKLMSSYDLVLEYDYLPSTAAALAAEVPAAATQFLNRDFNGLLKATVGKGEADSTRVSLRLQIWHT